VDADGQIDIMIELKLDMHIPVRAFVNKLNWFAE